MFYFRAQIDRHKLISVRGSSEEQGGSRNPRRTEAGACDRFTKKQTKRLEASAPGRSGAAPARPLRASNARTAETTRSPLAVTGGPFDRERLITTRGIHQALKSPSYIK
ncbi:hypothetical protein NDU88_012501 [Pleurodeles waltl]|uniref:Uncharacterized protein n=1 Tax=Pleurodeles waltl TaxID=8319 RepID=A0AAV7R0V3_PLEWA|nr:hypothetical protein NDU88_012501 [Pleurodeles waltl]